MHLSTGSSSVPVAFAGPRATAGRISSESGDFESQPCIILLPATREKHVFTLQRSRSGYVRKKAGFYCLALQRVLQLRGTQGEICNPDGKSGGKPGNARHFPIITKQRNPISRKTLSDIPTGPSQSNSIALHRNGSWKSALLLGVTTQHMCIAVSFANNLPTGFSACLLRS